MSTIKPIPDRYEKHGYVFTLLERDGRVAIYEQGRNGRAYAYEVVKIRVRKGGKQFGVEVPDSERLPCDEDWGVWGKTYSTSLLVPDEALRRAREQMRVWVAESVKTGPRHQGAPRAAHA